MPGLPPLRTSPSCAGGDLYSSSDGQKQLTRVIAKRTVYKGSLNAAYIRVPELFREAVRINAAGVIVAHNHPSGDPMPSPEGVSVTKQIVAAGKLLNIELLDHLCVGRGR